MEDRKAKVPLALFSARRLFFNLLFWIALFTFILGVRYYGIGNIAFINLPVEIPTNRIFVNGVTVGLSVGMIYTKR